MLVSKILEGVLASGATSISFTDSDIPNSFIRIGSTDPDLMPVSQSLSGSTLTITYEAQNSSKGIVVNLVKAGISVIDALNSDDADNALSAKQGKALKTLIDALSAPALSDLSDVDFTSLTDGDIIVYDGINQKFINNSIPSIPSNITDLSDVIFTSPTEGQILSIDSDGNVVNVDPSGAAGINYSTTEQNTGIKWTDGKYIYKKTFELASGTVTGGVINVANTTGIDNIIKCECTCIQTNNSRHYTLPLIRTTASECIYKNVYVDNGTLYMQIVSGTAYVLNTIKFTVWYTKS